MSCYKRHPDEKIPKEAFWCGEHILSGVMIAPQPSEIDHDNRFTVTVDKHDSKNFLYIVIYHNEKYKMRKKIEAHRPVVIEADSLITALWGDIYL